MKEKTNVAVIGSGYMGSLHARIYSEIDGIRLCSVCDVDKVKGRVLAEKFGANYVDNYYKILDDENIDALSICTPTKTHFEIASEALKAGKYVLIEKPVTYSVNEAKRLASLRDRKNSIVVVGHTERYNPVTKKIFQIFRSEVSTKEIISTISRRVGQKPKRRRETGVLYQLATHDIDIILSMIGKPKKICCNLVKKNGIEFSSFLLMHYPTMSSAIESSWQYKQKQRTFEIFLNDGFIFGDYLASTIHSEIRKKRKKFSFTNVEPLKEELK
ncbi:MAG: Gfo/Idh/MocA family oxidoreductase, partial [Thermoplasmatales archaeon]|nr:Gfo/Idh/MocA family oxidoreductase [Thermoplasmatales archaeon]